MEILKHKNSFLTKIFKKILGYDSGRFCLSTGNHKIFVPTVIHPCFVWVRLESAETGGCCHAPHDEIGYSIRHNGIMFNVSVNTEKCIVDWYTD